MRRIDVILADDHNIVREGLARYLAELSYVKSVRHAENGKQVIQLANDQAPDLVIMDIQMSEMDGIECSEILLKKYENVKILALSAVEHPKSIVQMIELGVQGYCLKNIDLEELDKAIRSVIENDFYQNDLVVNIMRKEVISQKYDIDHRHLVTDREKQILKMICQEKGSKEIGDKLNISHRTVEVARGELAKKIGVKGVVGLVRFAIKNGYDI